MGTGYKLIQDEDGNDIAFVGQYDPATGQPDGIVRAVYYSGGIYEGQMTPDGKPNGWGILYAGAFIRVGWWKDFAQSGNNMKLDGNWNVKKQGWFENSSRTAGFDRDH